MGNQTTFLCFTYNSARPLCGGRQSSEVALVGRRVIIPWGAGSLGGSVTGGSFITLFSQDAAVGWGFWPGGYWVGG